MDWKELNFRMFSHSKSNESDTHLSCKFYEFGYSALAYKSLPDSPLVQACSSQVLPGLTSMQLAGSITVVSRLETLLQCVDLSSVVRMKPYRAAGMHSPLQ